VLTKDIQDQSSKNENETMKITELKLIQGNDKISLENTSINNITEVFEWLSTELLDNLNPGVILLLMFSLYLFCMISTDNSVPYHELSYILVI
jgi:hypothetical protein